MADTQRTRTQILALFADNVTGQISAQDFRDFAVTVMESEFANPGDFWSKPQPKYTLTDKTARGWILYSQLIGSDMSFMNPIYMDASCGLWKRATVANSLYNGLVGLAMNSYASDYSTGQVLLEGCVYDSSFSATFSNMIGRPVYLGSTGSVGSIAVVATTNSIYILGFIMPSDNSTGSNIGKWYFRPNWAIVGS